jgi:hypothetical protein
MSRNSDPAIGFGARLGEELHTPGRHPGVGGTEILDLQEETHAAGRLLADHGRLISPIRPREQQAGLRIWRPDHHPPLGAPVVGLGRGVLHELEPQDVNEEADGRVVVADEDGDEAKVHGASLESHRVVARRARGPARGQLAMWKISSWRLSGSRNTTTE